MPAISQAFRCFDEVARRGSVRQAAEHLHLTPAAVNQQILNLEAQVGLPLFDRLPRGMQLSSAGEIMLAAVRRSQRDYDNALMQVEDLRALRRGHVSLGVSHSSAEVLVPQVISTVLAHHPGISFSVRTGSGEALLRWLASGEVDVAYCLRRSPPAGVAELRAWPQPLGVVTAPGHPLLALPRPPRLRDCLAHPLAMLEPGMELRAMVDRLGARAPRDARPLVETSSVAMVRRLVAGGLAVGFLIPENVDSEVRKGQLVWTALADAGAASHTALFQRQGWQTPAAMGLFLDALGSALDEIQQRFNDRNALRLQAFAT